MAIKMRRGLLKDFNPSKMQSGEFGVSVDVEPENQKVYMTFQPGVVKELQTTQAAEKYVADAKEYSEKAKASEDNAKSSEDKAKESETNAKTSETNADKYAKMSESYAKGGTGTREGEDADNSKYYCEQAKAIVGIGIATTETAGIVKPDGTSITVDADGTIHSKGGGGGGGVEVKDITLQEWKDGKAAGTLEDGVLYNTTDEIGEDNTLDILVTKEEFDTYKGKEFIETLSASDTDIAITDESIKADSTIDIYTSVYGVSPKNVVCVDGSLTITFKALDDDITVKVVVR